VTSSTSPSSRTARSWRTPSARTPQAEFTLSNTYDDSVKILKGELDANAAFMQGRIKVTGNMGKLMSLMPLTQSAEYKAILAKVADQTEI
jgi:putative sterol carrier protein